MYPDNIPNNHILNTLLTKCSILLFGKEQWVVRLPSLLSFFVFGFGVFQIVKLLLKSHSYFFLPATLLFVNPYLLDFFGLCRGYAISITMVILTIAFLINGYLNTKSKYIWFALISSILASYANFSALTFWAATTIIIWFFFLIKDNRNLKQLVKTTAILLLLSLAYLALITVPIQKMQSTNEFQYWTSHGFYNETVRSLLVDWIYNSPVLSRININFFAGLIAVALITNGLFFFRILRKEVFSLQTYNSPIFVTTVLLLLPIIINITQNKILGTPNLNGRTALFFFPLLSSVFIVTLSLIPEFKKKWAHKFLAIFFGVVLLSNVTHRISLRSVKEWDYDQNTLEVVHYLRDKYNGKPISLKTSWFFHPSFTFYTETGKVDWIDLQAYDYNMDINTPSE
jgi:hypothetical protein